MDHVVSLVSCKKRLAPKSSKAPPLQQRFPSWFVSLFCPRAFLYDGLAEGYTTFQFFDTIQALTSYLRGALCNRGLLKALGVGSMEASATAAALTFLTKDGVGMVASLFLATAFSHSFGRRVKFWRLFADVTNDVALTLDLLAPTLCEGSFSLLMCVLSMSSVLKAFCGVSSSATRASISHHFALNPDDLSDIAAKEGSQETLVTLLGMVGGYVLLEYVDSESTLELFALFAMLTLLHVLFNVLVVRSLHFRTLDWQRLNLVRNQANKSFVHVSSLESIWPPSWTNAMRSRFVSDTAVEYYVNSRDLPHIGFANVTGEKLVLIVDEDATAEEVVCACVCLLIFPSNASAQECASKGPVQSAMVVQDLLRHGWDLKNSRALLGDEESARVKFIL